MQQDGDEFWCELTSVLHRLVTVTTLHIGLCPVSVVHAVAQKMVWLQHFTAESIDDALKHSGRFTLLSWFEWISRYSFRGNFLTCKCKRVCGASYLHWLSVYYQLQFKIATLTYKTLATCQPSYLYNLLQVHQPSRALCSSTQKLLQSPFLLTDFGRCTFSCSSPATWNSIPTSIKKCSSLYSFKHHLKSHLIAQLINN